MTLVIDAMCAGFGGIATYALNLLAMWPHLYPDDHLHVLAPPDVATKLDASTLTVHERAAYRPSALGRPAVQTLELRRLVRTTAADAVLALLPSTSLLRTGAPTVVVVYDLRHELRPEQFTRRRRLMRRVSYGRGYSIADGFIAISARSLDDLHELHPRTVQKRGVVVHLAADHVDGWEGRAAGDYAIAFGHHSNKNVNLVLDAWQDLFRTDASVPRLRMTGINSATRPRVQAGVDARGLTNVVELMPFLSDRDFERLFAGAGVVVFPSDFEGFGLPVVEAMRLEKPVVVGPDKAVLEVAGGHAHVMGEWTAQALSASVRQSLDTDERSLRLAHDYAQQFTWVRATEQTRSALQDVVAGAAATRPRGGRSTTESGL